MTNVDTKSYRAPDRSFIGEHRCDIFFLDTPKAFSQRRQIKCTCGWDNTWTWMIEEAEADRMAENICKNHEENFNNLDKDS